MGNSRGSDHVKPTVIFCQCTGQRFFRHNSDCLEYPCTKGCRVSHRCSGNVILYTPTRRNQRMISGKCGCHGICPPWPIHLPRNISLTNVRVLVIQCGAHHGAGKWRTSAVLPDVGQIQLCHFEVNPHTVGFAGRKKEPVTLL